MAKMNFRNKLLVSIVPLFVAAIVVLAVVCSFTASKNIIGHMQDSMGQIVKKTSDELSAWIGDREREALLLSDNSTLIATCDGGSVDEARAMLEGYHKRSPFYEAIFLAHPSGEIFVDSIAGNAVGVNISQIPVYKINAEKSQVGEVWTGNVGKSPATGRPVALITAPIMKGGVCIGIVGTPIELNEFSKMFVDSTKIGESGYMFMLDANGLTLAHPKKERILETNLSQFDFGKQIISKKNGVIEYEWKGDEKISSFASYDKKGWIIAATINRDEFTASVKQINMLAWIVGTVATVLTCGITWLVTSRVFKVIQGVSTALTGAGGQITSASNQVSASSQSLAEGATEQAAGLEETSSSLEEMAAMTKQNADNAQQASVLAGEAQQAADSGSEAMERMNSAIQDIQKSSDETAKIIKVIDEIAFQTNLLALNAAVEAARAGEAGKGFAVVAEEVRNLAMRSAEAAKDTSSLIEGAVKNAKNGVEIASEVGTKLEGIVSSIGKTTELVAEIAAASQEQSQGIDQVNTAVTQIDRVTQSNAAHAEESASASEELSVQAVEMNRIVGQLVSLVGGETAVDSTSVKRPSSPSSARKTDAFHQIAGGKVGDCWDVELANKHNE